MHRHPSQPGPAGQPRRDAASGSNRDKHLIMLRANFLNPFAVVSKQMLKQLFACSNNQLPATPTLNHPMFLRFRGKKKKNESQEAKTQIVPWWSLKGCLHKTPLPYLSGCPSLPAFQRRRGWGDLPPRLKTRSLLHWENSAWQDLLMKIKKFQPAGQF